MSLGLAVFDRLVEVANAFVAWRDETCPPGSPEWAALTSLCQAIDNLIDAVVLTFPVEEEVEAVSTEPPESKEP